MAVAVAYLLAGICSFVIIPKFRAIYEDMFEGEPLPSLTKLIVGVPPLWWLVLSCIMAALLIMRDVRGRVAWLPNWLALVILVLSGLVVIVALYYPLMFFGGGLGTP